MLFEPLLRYRSSDINALAEREETRCRIGPAQHHVATNSDEQGGRHSFIDQGLGLLGTWFTQDR
jgi:hypothetical protein